MRGRRRARPARRGPALLLVGAALVLSGWVLSGCAGRLPLLETGSGLDRVEPWRLPPSAAPSQRLYRVSYEGPEGRGSLRLTLRLAAAGRFRITAADGLGRTVWSLQVTPDGPALLLDHRAGLYCLAESSVALPDLALEAVALEALPLLLLGRLPVHPGGTVTGTGGGELEVEDAGGRRWTARRGAAGELEAWTLWRDGAPLLWWSAVDGGAVLSHRGGSQFRWRQTVAEPTDGRLEPLTVPAGFAEGVCDAGA